MKKEREEPGTINNVEIKTEQKIAKPKRGIVFNCLALAIRDEGSKNGNPVFVLDSGIEVKINYERSTQEFYNVTTNDGITGFCMKSFIKVL